MTSANSTTVGPVLIVTTSISLLLSAAIFGFFYAWVCSTMWGLDAIDPRAAITAMNAMNESVRNAVFAPSFFGMPVALLITAGLAFASGFRRSSALFAIAGIVYIAGAFLPTALVNVPMNQALAAAPMPSNLDAAHQLWNAYSPRWQSYNLLRAIVSGVVFAMAVLGTVSLARGR